MTKEIITESCTCNQGCACAFRDENCNCGTNCGCSTACECATGENCAPNCNCAS